MNLKKSLVSLLSLCLCLAAAAPKAVAQAAPSADVQKEILTELRQIRALLERQQQPQPTAAAPAQETAKISNAGFDMGSKDAPITMVEFADYQCPFCKQFQTAVFNRLKKDYIDTGKVRFISRDLPLDMHASASIGAQAARCAGDQGKFWEMRDTLMAHSDSLSPTAIAQFAEQMGLKMPVFQECLDRGKYLPSISADVADANAAGILSTPSFVIGRSSGTSVEGVKVAGAQSFEAFQKILTDYVAQSQIQK